VSIQIQKGQTNQPNWESSRGSRLDAPVINSAKKNSVLKAHHGSKQATKKEQSLKRMFGKLDIVVIRYSGGQLRESKPCMHCTNYMKQIGIRAVYYSNAAGVMVKEKIKTLFTTHVSRRAKPY